MRLKFGRRQKQLLVWKYGFDQYAQVEPRANMFVSVVHLSGEPELSEINCVNARRWFLLVAS